MTLFIEIGIIIILASVFGVIARKLKQPDILGYLLVGLIVGPLGFKLINNQEVISSLATIGVAFLLFLVGLQLDWRKAKDIGWKVVIIALGQIIITMLLGWFFARFLGFTLVESMYIGLALTFSSTVIVVKLLTEHSRLDHLFGRITVGVLIIQDFAAILALAFLSNLHYGLGYESLAILLVAIFKGILLIALAILIGKYVIGYLFRQVAKYHESLFLVAIAWCFAVGIISYLLGLSVEIGAFLAGISLASSKYSIDVVAKVRSLRDFFIVIFFVILGLGVGQLSFVNIKLALILSLFVLVLHPLLILLIMGFLGFTKRNSFLTAVTLAQISEFSLVVAALGVKLGQISTDILGIITVVAIITITISSYLISHAYTIYNKLAPFLGIFERKNRIHSKSFSKDGILENHVVLIGVRRTGHSILRVLKKLKEKIVIVDFNPEVADEFSHDKIEVIYGDAADEEVINSLHLEKAKMIISTVPNFSDNIAIVKHARHINKKIIIFLMAFDVDEVLELYDAGADYVILPQHVSGDHISILIDEIALDEKKVLARKLLHIEFLRKFD